MVVQLNCYKKKLLETKFVIVQDDPLEDSGLFWHLSARQHTSSWNGAYVLGSQANSFSQCVNRLWISA